MNISDRIIKIRGTASRRSFANALGITESTLRNYENELSLPNSDLLKLICTSYDVSAEWLLLGQGNMLKSEESLKKHNVYEPTEDIIWIPMVNAVLSAGGGSLDTDGKIHEKYAFKSDFFIKKGDPNNMILMRVSGDSMTPEVSDGDMVLIDQSKKEILAGKIYAVGFEDAIYLKRIDKIPNKTILKSTNKAYDPIEIDTKNLDPDAFRIIGRVLWCAREYS